MRKEFFGYCSLECGCLHRSSAINQVPYPQYLLEHFIDILQGKDIWREKKFGFNASEYVFDID